MGTRYNWQGSSSTRQVEVSKNLIGQREAIIYVPEVIDSKMAALPQYLKERGFICHDDEIKGTNVIKVDLKFLKNEKSLISTIQSGGFVSGPASKIKVPDRTPKLSTFDKLRRYGQNLSGIFGNIGHVALFIQGAFMKDKNLMTTGALYASSASISAVFGSGASALRFTEMVSDWQDYMEKEGYKIADPLMRTPVVQYRERTFFQKVIDWIKNNPIIASQIMGLWGNLTLALSGFREMMMSTRKGFSRFAYSAPGVDAFISGAAAGTGSLVAILVKEATPKQNEEYKKEKGFWKTLSEGHVKEALKILPHRLHVTLKKSPLSILGIFLLIDNFSMLRRAWRTQQTYDIVLNGDPAQGVLSNADRIQALDVELATGVAMSANPKEASKQEELVKKNMKKRRELVQQKAGVERLRDAHIPYRLFPGITGLFWTAASASQTLATTRNKALETKEIWEELYTHVTNAIRGLPENQQEEAIEKAAVYFSERVVPNAEEIEAGIRAKLAVLKQSPWSKAIAAEKSTEVEGAAATQSAPTANAVTFSNDDKNSPENRKKFAEWEAMQAKENTTVTTAPNDGRMTDEQRKSLADLQKLEERHSTEAKKTMAFKDGTTLQHGGTQPMHSNAQLGMALSEDQYVHAPT